jgi:hypothetical protein
MELSERTAPIPAQIAELMQEVSSVGELAE